MIRSLRISGNGRFRENGRSLCFLPEIGELEISWRLSAGFVVGGFMRILGLDYGSKTVGVAVSDELGITAQGLETISRKSEGKLRQTCARLEELIQEYQVTAIVLGYPKNMNNTEGERAGKTLEFKEMLERRTNLPVILWDERLSTVSAERTLMESGVRRENRKAVIDKIAAVFILQNYLDASRRNEHG